MELLHALQNVFVLYFRDAVIVCVVDTLFSVQAGFLMFSSLGILASELNTTISNLVDSSKYRVA